MNSYLDGLIDSQNIDTGQHAERLRASGSVLEKCGYFLPRVMFLPSQYAPRITWGDVIVALSGLTGDDVNLSAASFWHDWLERWKTLGDQYSLMATSTPTVRGRRDALRSAAACYHWAEFMYFEDAAEKLALRSRIRESFEASMESSPIECVSGTLDLGGTDDSSSVPYWLYLPPPSARTVEPMPCVVMSNGLDSMTEVEILSFAEMYWDRGIATILFDGPGQGIQLGQTPLRVDMEHVVNALLDHLATIPWISMQRLGFFGVSFGGYFSLRIAQAIGERFRCVVNASGGPRVAPYVSLPRRLKADFSFALMTPDGDVQSQLDAMELDTRTPAETEVLTIHGVWDDIFPYADLVALDRAWGDAHSLLLYGEEGHVCLQRLASWSSEAADWVSERLLAN